MFVLSDHIKVYKRTVHGVLEILGSTGGVMKAILVIFGWVFPVIS